MANPTLNSPLFEGGIRDLVTQAANSRSLPPVFLQTGETEGAESKVLQCFIVYVRTGGFMIVAPPDGDPQGILEQMPQTMIEPPAYSHGEVIIETSRGRALGPGPVVLIDLPWPFAAEFHTVSRITTALREKLVTFRHSDIDGRPVRAGTLELADAWIESMDPATGQDYLTGEELIPEPSVRGPSTPGAQPNGGAPDVAALQRRIAELEDSLQAAQQASQLVQPKAAALGSRAPVLFNQKESEQPMSAQDWGRLQLLAGSPPPRVGMTDRRRAVAPAKPAPADNMLLEVQREAAEDEGEDPSNAMLSELVQSSSDPMHKLLALQMQQNQALLMKLAGPRDPVLGALAGGSDNAGGSSSGGGVKGCLAREAFIRAVADHTKVANSARVNALRELGMDPSRESGSLIKKYMERRMPLKDHRLLTYFTAMIAEAWSVGYDSGNTEMLGLLARMLFFCEQVAIDQGRTTMGWMLTGWQEPPFHLLTGSGKHPGLQPHSRLCNAAWVSANIAYLRDMDFLESKLQTLGTSKGNPRKTEEGDPSAKAAAKSKPKKAKAGGKGGKAESEGKAEPSA